MARSNLLVPSLVLAPALVISAALLSRAGPLDPPPGPVASSYKTLTSVEPRTEINSTNTPGDLDSVYRITVPGAYYLSGNVVGNPGRAGIEISASGVTIDLNGFTMTGVTGSLSAIRCTGSTKGVQISNGAISAWGASGVDVTSALEVQIRSIVSFNNGANGIHTAGNVLIESCVANGNTAEGIFVAGLAAIVRSCVAHNNGSNGIHHAGAGNIIDCLSTGNAGNGFLASGAVTITNCQTWGNISSGFDVVNCSIINCNAQSNSADGFHSNGATTFSGCQSLGNSGDGFEVTSRSSVIHCSSQGNNIGIHVTGADNRIEANNIVQNINKGIRADIAGSVFVRNQASGNGGFNYDLVAGNVGLFVSATSSGAVSGSAGGTSPGSTDPSANFSY